VICLVLPGRPAVAITTIGGDAICRGHVPLRVESPSLAGAVQLARAGLSPPRAPRTAAAAVATSVGEIQLSLSADPLTAREYDVLRYLASTLTGADIAAELFVTVNTVKTHQRGIYRKLALGVTRARLFGLL
jgi:DNA-binding NarL/FixJ family response regulator